MTVSSATLAAIGSAGAGAAFGRGLTRDGLIRLRAFSSARARRWSRHADQRSENGAMTRATPPVHSRNLAKLNVETRYSEAIRQVAASTAAPVTFIADSRAPASSVPASPPAGTAPEYSRHPGISETRTDVLPIKSAEPNNLTPGASNVSERTHFQASRISRTGRMNAVRPNTCRPKSARWAPIGPIRLWGRAGPLAVFQEASWT